MGIYILTLEAHFQRLKIMHSSLKISDRRSNKSSNLGALSWAKVVGAIIMEPIKSCYTALTVLIN